MSRSELGDATIDALAAYRLTRLVTKDSITLPIRARIIRAAYRRHEGELPDADERRPDYYWQDTAEGDPAAPKVAELVVCRWCAGMWISCFVIVARRYAGVLWDPLARALALSAAAALVAGLEDG